MSKHYIVLFLNYFVNTFSLYLKEHIFLKTLKYDIPILIKIVIGRKIPSNKGKYF